MCLRGKRVKRFVVHLLNTILWNSHNVVGITHVISGLLYLSEGSCFIWIVFLFRVLFLDMHVVVDSAFLKRIVVVATMDDDFSDSIDVPASPRSSRNKSAMNTKASNDGPKNRLFLRIMKTS